MKHRRKIEENGFYVEDRIFFHCDVNNFFASVEALIDPELKDKAVAVCGDPKKRHGIVLAKSIPAKAAGVKTGDTVWEAEEKCPGIILIPPTYKKYTEYSALIYSVYASFTPEVESFGLDECWLDMTGTIKFFGGPSEAADLLRRTVTEKTGGLTVSIGGIVLKSVCKARLGFKKTGRGDGDRSE